MLAYYVVERLEKDGAKVQLPTASTYGVYLPSRLHCRWLNSGLYVYLSSRGCFAYELGNWQSPSRGDRLEEEVRGRAIKRQKNVDIVFVPQFDWLVPEAHEPSWPDRQR